MLKPLWWDETLCCFSSEIKCLALDCNWSFLGWLHLYIPSTCGTEQEREERSFWFNSSSVVFAVVSMMTHKCSSCFFSNLPLFFQIQKTEGWQCSLKFFIRYITIKISYMMKFSKCWTVCMWTFLTLSVYVFSDGRRLFPPTGIARYFLCRHLELQKLWNFFPVFMKLFRLTD